MIRVFLIIVAGSFFLLPLAPIAQGVKVGHDAKPTQTAPTSIPPKQPDSTALKNKGPDYKFWDQPIKVVVTDGPKKDAYDKAGFWVNFTLAVIGFGGIGVAFITLKKLERQTKATEDAVTGSQKAFQLAEDTAKRQLRAYLCYREGRVFVGNDGSAYALIELENTGQTPAHAVQGSYHAGFATQIVKASPPQADAIKSVAVVGAGKSFNIVLPINQWNPGTVAALKGGLIYFVMGEFTYRDIFKEEDRMIRFQITLGGPGGFPTITNKDGKSFYQMQTDSQGNEGT